MSRNKDKRVGLFGGLFKKRAERRNSMRKEEAKVVTTEKCANCRKKIVAEHNEGAVFLNGQVLHEDCVIPFRRKTKASKLRRARLAESPIDRFKLKKMCGRGTFATVWAAEDGETGERYAIKVISKKDRDERTAEMVRREREIMSRTSDGPFLASVLHDMEDAQNNYLVMEVADGGDLFDLISSASGGLELKLAVTLSAQIMLGIEFLHFKGIIYRDLKPENVLLKGNGRVMLTDFGISKDGLDGDARTQTFCGTKLYQAPEMIRGLPYGKEVDWWSFGVVLFEMLAGLPPFYTRDVTRVAQKILSEEPEYPTEWQDPEIELLIQLLVKDPEKRLKDSLAIRQCSFFKDIVWDELLEGKLDIEWEMEKMRVQEALDKRRNTLNAFADFDSEFSAGDSDSVAGVGDSDAIGESEGEELGDLVIDSV